jgi:hypothetical protein
MWLFSAELAPVPFHKNDGHGQQYSCFFLFIAKSVAPVGTISEKPVLEGYGDCLYLVNQGS